MPLRVNGIGGHAFHKVRQKIAGIGDDGADIEVAAGRFGHRAIEQRRTHIRMIHVQQSELKCGRHQRGNEDGEDFDAAGERALMQPVCDQAVDHEQQRRQPKTDNRFRHGVSPTPFVRAAQPRANIEGKAQQISQREDTSHDHRAG